MTDIKSPRPRNISKKQVVEEFIKCAKDPVYFIKTYAKIQHPVHGLVPFKTYPYQDDVIKAYLNNRFNVILKARQLGLTTITAAYCAWLTIFHRDKNVLIVATKQETSKNMIRIIKNIYKYLPVWIKQFAVADVNNRHSVEFSNGSRVKATTTSGDVGRSESPSFLVVDEAAHIPMLEEIWIGLGPAISAGGAAALLSTPNGTGNYFHTCYVQAKNGENNFNCTLGTYVNPNNPEEVHNDRLLWWVHPDHDQQWFENETRGKSSREIAQEFMCQFLASGDTFIYHEDIGRIEKTIKEPTRKYEVDRNVWIWEEPVPGAKYLIPADVSRGDSADFSAFHIVRIDTNPLRQCAEYKAKIRPDRLGILLMQVSAYYNNAIIAPENNSGWASQTILKIEEANYPHLYYSERTRTEFRNGYNVDPYYAMQTNEYRPGYQVSSANRLTILGKLEQYLRMGDIIVYSARLVEELKTFVVKRLESGRERPEAQRGYNDDLIMSLAGGLFIRDLSFSVIGRGANETQIMADCISVSTTRTSDTNGFNNGIAGKNIHARTQMAEFIQRQNKMRMADGTEIDLSWVISSG